MNRQSWPRHIEKKLAYGEKAAVWYFRRCENSVLPPEARSYCPVSGPDDPDAMAQLVRDFTAEFESHGIREVRVSGGQGGVAIISVQLDANINSELIPYYFRGVRVSASPELTPLQSGH